ncbi:hypothetical protein GGS24DRAFT_506309 [Hypoxylon argillaceum]|nr:hypothetical protein GGS24DRAFT_506309 [Hypoxylon argillaceum]
MRIGCLQFAPQVGDINNNLNRADAVLSKANPENLDLLVLPELAFTGYNFKTLREISPFLEPKGSGISALWARTVALKLNCLVTVGYPEKVDVKPKWPTSPEYYNSVIVVNNDGETIANYRKTFLYYTDETWALEGQEGFYGGFIPGLGNTSLGICMDINPRRFEAPWHAFEFAFHCLEVEANIVIMTMAWNTRQDARMFSRMPNEPDMETLTYWVSRLEPLIRSETQEEIIVIFCNRCGIEDDAVYAGTSAVIGIKDGEVNVYGILGRGEKDLLVVDTEKPPCAKLVYRPDDQVSPVGSALDSISGSKDIGQPDSARTTASTPRSAGPSAEASYNETTRPNGTQYQALLEEARLVSQPHSPVSQESRSSLHSQSTNKLHSRNRSYSNQTSQSSQKSPSGQKKSSASSMTKSHYVAPRDLTRAGSDVSLSALNDSVTARATTTFKRSKSSDRLGASKDVRVSQGRKHQDGPARGEKARAHPIQIPQLPMETDTILTPTAPSPTPLAIRPKLVIPKDAYERYALPHFPSPVSLAEPGPHTSGIYNSHVSVGRQNETATSTTPFDETIPQSPSRFFWIPPETLLRTPIQPRKWTPARADSPTLSPSLPTYPRAYAKPATPVETQHLDPQLIRHGLASSGRLEGVRNGESQPISKRAVDSVQSFSTSSQNVPPSKPSDRSDSPFANRPDWAAIAKRLEALSPRPDSVAQNPSTSFSPRPGSNLAQRIEINGNSSDAAPVRPPSTKSRNVSMSRAANPIGIDDPLDGQRKESRSRASIRAGASASVFGDNSTSDYVVGYEKSGIGRHQARAQSRGRPGAPSDPNATRHRRPDSARASPRDSPIPGRRPSATTFRFRTPAESDAEISRISPEWSLNGTADDDEIIGEIIVRHSPNCLVHGRPQVAKFNSSERADVGAGSDSLDRAAYETSGSVTSEGKGALKTENSLEAAAHSSMDGAEQHLNKNISSVESLSIPRSFSAPQSLIHSKTPKDVILSSVDDSTILITPLTVPFGQRLPTDMAIKL